MDEGARGTVSLDQMVAIAERHGLTPPVSVPRPWVGATSAVYPLADVVVKIPFDRPDAIRAVTIDAAIAPLARSLGARVPDLIAFDDSLRGLPVPHAVFRRVTCGTPLDRTGRSDSDRSVWGNVGRQLALIHAVTDPASVPIELRTFRQSPDVDPRPWVDALHDGGVLSADDARWLRELLDRIAPIVLGDETPTLCHGDVSAANILVDGQDASVLALIDWAGAGWLDPVWDFAGVPLEVVPWMLEGHRGVGPLPNDATAEARICWCQIQTRIHAVRNPPESTSVRRRVAGDVARVRRFARSQGLA